MDQNPVVQSSPPSQNNIQQSVGQEIQAPGSEINISLHPKLKTAAKILNIFLIIEIIFVIITFFFSKGLFGCGAQVYDLIHPFGYNGPSNPGFANCMTIFTEPGILPQYSLYLTADIFILTLLCRISVWLMALTSSKKQ